MIHASHTTDQTVLLPTSSTETGGFSKRAVECWFLHGAVGAAGDWREISSLLAAKGILSRSVDLWRFLSCESVSLSTFAQRLNAEASGEISRGNQRILIGYSMGARLAMHALLQGGPWDAAILISGNPGLRSERERSERLQQDADWATQALSAPWHEFLEKWNAQSILGKPIRDEASDLKLKQRRREIARSFIDWSLGAQEDLRPRLVEITIPTLWITGEMDGKFSAFAAEAASMSSHFSHEIIPKAGHRVPWEQPETLVAQIIEHMRKISE